MLSHSSDAVHPPLRGEPEVYRQRLFDTVNADGPDRYRTPRGTCEAGDVNLINEGAIRMVPIADLDMQPLPRILYAGYPSRLCLRFAPAQDARVAEKEARVMENPARIVVTGLGAVTPLGVGIPTFWERLRAGESGVGLITTLDASDFPYPIAGEVRGFDPSAFMEAKAARRMDRFAQFAVAAAGEAVADARLDLAAEDRERVGLSSTPAAGGHRPRSTRR